MLNTPTRRTHPSRTHLPLLALLVVGIILILSPARALASTEPGPALSSSCQANDPSDPLRVSCAFPSAGGYTLPVGPYATQASVEAIGAAGNTPNINDGGQEYQSGGLGGAGGDVAGTITFPAATSDLFVEVGGRGAPNWESPWAPTGAFNGGGASSSTLYSGIYYGTYTPGSGGGASDVRTVEPGQAGTLESRLIVAGGGGGGGLEFNGQGASGGAAGASGGSTGGEGGGEAGSASSGGAGGNGGYGTSGGGGDLGNGGNGGQGDEQSDENFGGGGGGGGGGYYGGGGGGGGDSHYATGGGGGGGGSDLVPSEGTSSTAALPASVTVTYEREAATTALVAGSPSSTYGHAVTLTATVTGATDAIDGGTITFYNGSAALGSPVAVEPATGTATLEMAPLAGGTHSLTAAYSGDAAFAPSTSGALSHIVTTDTTTTVVTSTATTSSWVAPATFTATVTSASGASILGGTVQFYAGGTAIGTAASLTGGVATISDQGLLDAGATTITATYSGETSTRASTSTGLAHTYALVSMEGSDFYANSCQPTLAYGSTLTADGSLGRNSYYLQQYIQQGYYYAEDGAVQLYDGTTPLGYPEPLWQLGYYGLTSQISFEDSSLSAGVHHLHFEFSGNSQFAASDSDENPYSECTTVTVNEVHSTTTLASSQGSAPLGQAPTFTVSVTRADGVTPTGTIQLADDGTTLGSPATLGSNGKATIEPGPLPLGANSVTAAYTPGDAYTNSSTSSALSQPVTSLATSLALSTTPTSVHLGEALAVSTQLTVTGAPATGPGSEDATGSVTFYDGGQSIGTASVEASGLATLRLPNGLTLGSHVLTATYVGDTDHLSSTSTPVALNVDKALTSLTLAIGASEVSGGRALSATLAPLTTSGSPSGTVEFYDGSNLLGSAALPASGGTETVSLPLAGLAPGSHALQAVYGGDSEFDASTSHAQDLDIAATTLDAGPAEGATTGPAATFAFSNADPTVRFQCRLDSGVWTPCTSPQGYTGLAEGAHSFQVQATGRSYVTEPVITRGFTVDGTLPVTTISGGPEALTASTQASFTLTADETGVTFECSLDSAPLSPCPEPLTYTGLADGTHVLAARATDAQGNVEATPVTYTWTVSSEIPSAPAITSDTTTATGASFGFSGTPGATFSCSLDGAPAAPCTSPQGYVGLAAGAHTFAVTQTDALARTSAPAALAFTLTGSPVPALPAPPTPGPAASPIMAPAITTSSFGTTSADFSFSGVVGATFSCSLDGAPATSCASPLAYASLPAGQHSFSVTQTDADGQASGPATEVFTLTGAPAAIVTPLVPRVSTVHGGAVPVGCALDGATLAWCSIRAYADGHLVGSAIAHFGPGEGSTLHVRLGHAGLALINRLGGVEIAYHGVVTTTDGQRLSFTAHSRVLPLGAVSVALDGMFSFGSARLGSQWQTRLRALASELAGAERIACVGYADSLGSASAPSQRLGMQRARAVCALLGDDGAHAERTARVKGSDSPIASLAVRDRRVELIVRY